jgi:hypothetical protein
MTRKGSQVRVLYGPLEKSLVRALWPGFSAFHPERRAHGRSPHPQRFGGESSAPPVMHNDRLNTGA